jgi:hypothetical protein
MPGLVGSVQRRLILPLGGPDEAVKPVGGAGGSGVGVGVLVDVGVAVGGTGVGVAVGTACGVALACEELPLSPPESRAVTT